MMPRSAAPLARWPGRVLVVLALVLSGCFTHDTLVRVNPDGSGTVEQTVILQGPMVQMMQSFGPGGADDGMELYTLEELEQAAQEMGEGVRFVSVDSVTTDAGGLGYRALYAFEDVRSLNINQSPSDDLAAPATNAAALEGTASQDIRFDFTPGSPSRLTIFVPQPDPDSLAAAAPDTAMVARADSAQQAMQMAMLREMLKGGGVTLAVEVNGTVLETNAQHHNGARITLLAFDFDALLENEERLRTLNTAQPQTLAEARALMEGIEGLSVETQETVTVQFD
jgi:hypothetical protein